MKNTKHTPGPWTIDTDWSLIMARQAEVCAIHSSNKKDQALIAAAPDLLEALERLVMIASVELLATRPDVIEQAEKAIAKAKGEQQYE